MRLRSDAFADYVDEVFRRQNQLATSLALEIDSADPDSEVYRQLEAADIELQTACRSLNELASARRSGAEPGGLRALRQARQAPECERAAAAAADLL